MTKITIDSLQPLIGRDGLLPSHYSESVTKQLKLNNTVLFDFYKIFHNRLLHKFQEIEKNMSPVSADDFINKFPFFCYYSLFAFNTKSLSSLQKFLANYFDIKCEVKKTTTPYPEIIKLAKNSYLSSHSNIKKNKLMVSFTTQTHAQYLLLLTEERFWDQFFNILLLYFKIEKNCIIQFQFPVTTPQTTALKQCLLGWNSWLGSISPGNYKIQLNQVESSHLGPYLST